MVHIAFSIARKLSLAVLFTSLSQVAIAQTTPTAELYDSAASAYQTGDFRKAEAIWGDLADDGDANSQYAMGIMHLKKEASQASDTTAFEFLVDAAKQQHLAAIFNLGVAYWEGRGVSRQPKKALNWWEIAAQRQDAGAQYNLGLAYYIGEGREQDNDKAIHWIQQALDNKHPQAQSLLTNIQEEIKARKNDTAVVASKKKIQPITSSPPTIKTALPKKNANGNNTSNSRTTAQLASTTFEKPDPVASNNGKRTVSNLSILRSQPTTSATQLATLKPGDSVNVTKTIGGWSKVTVRQSYPVWIYETFLTDKGKGVGEVSGNDVNIRPNPSTDSQTSTPLGKLNKGERVAIVLKRSPWVKIIPANAFPAWVASKDIN